MSGPVDSFGRQLDDFGRPLDNRLQRETEKINFDGFPNVIIAFPAFGDWLAMYNPRKKGNFAASKQTYEDFKRRHQKQMTNALREIAARTTGRALLAESNSNPGLQITILPMDFVSSQKKWIKYHTNAIAEAPAEDAKAIGTYVRHEKDGSIVRGSGLGADAEIYFSPDRLRSRGPGMNPDEVLYHEMVHAVRFLRGISGSSFRMDNGYSNEEEFAAVTVTNVYLSEKKQTVLRAKHGGRGEALRDPQKFLDSPDVPAPGARGLLGLFRLRHPSFFSALAKIGPSTAAFNPFRQLAEETVKARAAHEAKMRAFDRKN